MKLFHQLIESDQHNAIHYCMHIAVEDMLEDGVEMEPFSEEDKKAKDILVKAVAEALKLEKEDDAFSFMIDHAEAGPLIFDIALDMARGSYYHSDDELVIHYESLRPDENDEEQALAEEHAETEKALEEVAAGGIKAVPSKGSRTLN